MSDTWVDKLFAVIESFNNRLEKIEEYISHTSSPEIEVEETNIEVGKFYDWDSEKIFIKADISIGSTFNNLENPRFIGMKSNGSTFYIYSPKLKPWDFKGEQPTVCPEVGKWYKNRNGTIGKCEQLLVFKTSFPFKINGYSYDYFGGYFDSNLSELDLTEEVPEPKEELVLEDGCWYENRKGKNRKVIDIGNGTFKSLDPSLPYVKYHGYFLDKNGREFLKDESDEDLIKKVPPPIQLEVDSFWMDSAGNKIYLYFKDRGEDRFHGIHVGKSPTIYFHSDGSTIHDNIPNRRIVAKWEG